MAGIDLKPLSYDVVMVDPPWEWQTYSSAGKAKSPEAQYSTMTFEAIEALRVGDLLAPGGVMLMWCTWPLIWRQAEVMRKWGVRPVTGGAWAKRTRNDKLRWGPGYVLRSVCEPFLIGTLADSGARGPGVCNLIETIDDALVDGLAREHSRKPDEAFALIEAIAPGLRRADIFARQRRPGWDGWGNELSKFDAVGAAEGGDHASDR